MSKELNECSSLPFFFNERSLALYYNCVIRPLRVKFVLIGWSKKTYLRSLLPEYFSILGGHKTLFGTGHPSKSPMRRKYRKIKVHTL